MGLDIHTYTKLVPIPVTDADEVRLVIESETSDPQELAEDRGWLWLDVNPSWPERAEGLALPAFFRTVPINGYPDVPRGVSSVFSFRVGSYSGYNRWREELAKLAGIDDLGEWWQAPDLSAPFGELLCFSDCEGVIGPVVSQRLVTAFNDYELRVARSSAHSTFLPLYKNFQRAFQLAADGGCVKFT